MDYLIANLFWYGWLSFAIGVGVGWISCGPSAD